MTPSASRTPSPLQRQRYHEGRVVSTARDTTLSTAPGRGGGDDGGGGGDDRGGRDRSRGFDHADEFNASFRNVTAPRLINSRVPPPTAVRFGREDTHDADMAADNECVVEMVAATAGVSMAVAETGHHRDERGVSSAAQLLKAAISVTDESGRRDVHVHEDSSASLSDESSIADSFASLADDTPDDDVVAVSPPSSLHPPVVSSSVSGHQPVTPRNTADVRSMGGDDDSDVGAPPTAIAHRASSAAREGVHSTPAAGSGTSDVATRTRGSVPLITSTSSGPNYLDYVPNFEAMRGKRPSIVNNIMGSPATPGAHYGNIDDNASDSSFSDS